MCSTYYPTSTCKMPRRLALTLPRGSMRTLWPPRGWGGTACVHIGGTRCRDFFLAFDKPMPRYKQGWFSLEVAMAIGRTLKQSGW